MLQRSKRSGRKASADKLVSAQTALAVVLTAPPLCPFLDDPLANIRGTVLESNALCLADRQKTHNIPVDKLYVFKVQIRLVGFPPFVSSAARRVSTEFDHNKRLICRYPPDLKERISLRLGEIYSCPCTA